MCRIHLFTAAGVCRIHPFRAAGVFRIHPFTAATVHRIHPFTAAAVCRILLGFVVIFHYSPSFSTSIGSCQHLGLDLGWGGRNQQKRRVRRGEVMVKFLDYGGSQEVSLELFSTVALILYIGACNSNSEQKHVR